MNPLTDQSKSRVLHLNRCGVSTLRVTPLVEQLVQQHKPPTQSVGEFLTVGALKAILHCLIEQERWGELKATVVALVPDDQAERPPLKRAA